MSAGVSQYNLAKKLSITQSGLSRLLTRTKERSEASKLPLWDPQLYATEPGRGPPEQPLSQEQKDAIIAVATQGRDTREKQSSQAISDGDFDHLNLPIKLSVTRFENIMYEAGYARRAPGFKPTLDDVQRERRFQWALAHNPDLYEYGDGLGFDFRRVIYTDETPARVGEQRGMKRAWARDSEIYDPEVKRPKIRNNCALQFYGSFTYDAKGRYHIYGKESTEQKKLAKQALDEENQRNKEQREKLVPQARAALRELGDTNANSRAWAWAKRHELKRGDRSRGGIDGYRHREEVLKPLLVPWINSLYEEGRAPVLLEDGAPAHTSKIALEYLEVSHINKLAWPGHSPDVNAEEHAWPWIRRHITQDFMPSTCEQQCRAQWAYEWEQMPQEIINKWILSILKVVRQIIAHRGDNSFHDGGG
ncbi:hypothetical protein BU23DRAFT_557913 [Bimuria novae-zelandiae CBS 107.79]|uniref:Tc1-like transposase DDE domain-containing protein n=1 Tax=Bimuria novae-zelandiae CBS 107.79 TaxID=1447943 RepID=A0A6A5UZ07_9PLEO|nr:hypothetical protein BU23DRAFT_557913 [Bimuria novae-zelandiae CBS 107.79]